jgi:hypothetical protein
MGILREADGKRSFSRTFGAACCLSILAGWWIDLFSGYDLPALSAQVLAAGLLPYGINVGAKAIAGGMAKARQIRNGSQRTGSRYIASRVDDEHDAEYTP